MAGSKQISVMMKDLGWGSGFRLPIANDENKRLEEILEAKQSKLVSLTLELQEVTGAIDAGAMFTKNLQSKIKHTKDVEVAKRSQLEQEKLLLQQVDRDRKRTEDDIRKMNHKIRSLQDSNKIKEATVLRRKDDLSELVEIIQFDKKAITAYEEKFAKEDAYISLIEEFKDTDNEKLEKCGKEYQQLGEKIKMERIHLDKVIVDTNVMEEELQELARRFRKAHAGRNQSIEVWKRTLDVLEDRDEEMLDLSKAYGETALALNEKSGILEKQEDFLKTVQGKSKCYQYQLKQLERQMVHTGQLKNRTQAEIDENEVAVGELVAYISATDRNIKSMQTKLNKLSCDNDCWQEKLDALNEEMEYLRTKYESLSKEKLSSKEQTNQLNEFLEQEEKKVEILGKELHKQTTAKAQRESQIQNLSEEILAMEHEAKSLKLATSKTVQNYKKAKNFQLRKETIIYRLDLKVSTLMTKIERLENPHGGMNENEYFQIQHQLDSLKKIFEQQMQAEKSIVSHIRHVNQVAIMCSKELQLNKVINSDSKEKVEVVGQVIRKISKESDQYDEEKKELTVRNSLLQVQLRRMAESVLDYESKMYDLEQERLTMKMSVKERKIDIEKQASLLKLLKHELMEECHKTRAKCHAVSQDIKGKKQKYESVMGQMWAATSSKDDTESVQDGSNRSEAYYIIKLAQEREFYRKEGDKWDERVKEAEKVLEGLQNTLALLTNTNVVFKESLKPATDETVEGQKLKELKQQQLEIYRNIKLLKDERENQTRKLLQVQLKLDKMLGLRAEHEHQMLERQYELQKLILELKGQQEKIDRATLQANRLVKKLSELDSFDADLLQTDLRLRVTKEKYEYAVQTLEKLLQCFPKLGPDTIEFLQQKGMMDLAMRLFQKSSAAPSPYHSGRATPQAHKNFMHASKFKDVDEGVRRSSATLPIIPPTPMRKKATSSKRESAVSFGELRQALQEAVEEQKSLGTGSEKESMTNSATMSKRTSVTRSQSSGSSGHLDRKSFSEAPAPDDQ